jgi:hypothetical protein
MAGCPAADDGVEDSDDSEYACSIDLEGWWS